MKIKRAFATFLAAALICVLIPAAALAYDDGRVGEKYYETLYTFDESYYYEYIQINWSGDLPEGISMKLKSTWTDDSGYERGGKLYLTGTPKKAGTFVFDVECYYNGSMIASGYDLEVTIKKAAATAAPTEEPTPTPTEAPTPTPTPTPTPVPTPSPTPAPTPTPRPAPIEIKGSFLSYDAGTAITVSAGLESETVLFNGMGGASALSATGAPAGMNVSLNSDGTISLRGTPEEEGVYTLNISLTLGDQDYYKNVAVIVSKAKFGAGMFGSGSGPVIIVVIAVAALALIVLGIILLVRGGKKKNAPPDGAYPSGPVQPTPPYNPPQQYREAYSQSATQAFNPMGGAPQATQAFNPLQNAPQPPFQPQYQQYQQPQQSVAKLDTRAENTVIQPPEDPSAPYGGNN